jgi:hypothetical protein
VDIVVTKVHDPGRYRRPGAQALQERRRVHAKAACALRRTAEQRGVAAGRGAQRVFTNWNLKRMTGWIKDGSRALKWNTHLIWTLHSLRHGVAAEIFGKWKCLTRVRATTGHAGDVGAVRYARSNARRLEMMTRSNEERAAAAARGRRG